MTEGVSVLSEGEEQGLLVVIARLGSRIKKTEEMYRDIVDERDEFLKQNGVLREAVKDLEEQVFPLLDESGRSQIDRIQARVQKWNSQPTTATQDEAFDFIDDIIKIVS